MRYDDKVAVITGASRGIGAGMARVFADHGLRLGLCARREPTAPEGARALTRALDVTDPARRPPDVVARVPNER